MCKIQLPILFLWSAVLPNVVVVVGEELTIYRRFYWEVGFTWDLLSLFGA